MPPAASQIWIFIGALFKTKGLRFPARVLPGAILEVECKSVKNVSKRTREPAIKEILVELFLFFLSDNGVYNEEV